MNSATSPLVLKLIDSLPYGDRQLATAKLYEADPGFVMLIEQALRLQQAFNGLGEK